MVWLQRYVAEIGMGDGMPLRVAVTGSGQSPSVDAVMELVGKERVIARIKMALEFIAEREANAAIERLLDSKGSGNLVTDPFIVSIFMI